MLCPNYYLAELLFGRIIILTSNWLYDPIKAWGPPKALSYSLLTSIINLTSYLLNFISGSESKETCGFARWSDKIFNGQELF